MNEYYLKESQIIKDNLNEFMFDLDEAHRVFKSVFPDKDSTWGYHTYNIFALTAPSTS